MTDTHEPSIRTGESVSGESVSLERWIAEHCFLWTEQNLNQVIEIPVVSAYDLRELMKSKFLIDRSRMEFWRNDLALHGVGDIETAADLDAISALHPTSSGDD